MPTHVTARIAWHTDGWNGGVCRAPEKNTYCVGWKSFPGDVIARERDLDKEKKLQGCSGNALAGYVPPCSYSYNAFGLDEAPAASNPPDFFFGNASRREWTLPPATVSVWPYEAMYADEVKVSGTLDNNRRRELALKFFEPIEADCGSNFIFYYANYSNPLSEDEAPRYALVGVSRIAKVGPELVYNDVKPEIAAKYAGGMIWARDITSAYPVEGLRLPYHLFAEEPERLAEFAVFPENPILCKYGSKHLTDDDAIGLLEQFLAKVRGLKNSSDKSDDWGARETWLLSAIAELWTHRGIYPGLLKALEAAGAVALVDGVKSLSLRDGYEAGHAAAFAALESGKPSPLTSSLSSPELSKLSRNWRLLDDGARLLLRDILPRFALDTDVMEAIASDQRSARGLTVEAQDIADNPYLIAELYCGADSSDRISWSTIDRGVLPSPGLGGGPLADMEFNDPRRFRSLCAEHLRQEPKHTFRFAKDLLIEIAQRMDRLPAWKQALFSERYFDVDAEFLSGALSLRPSADGLCVYLKPVFEDERTVEKTLKDMATRPDLDLRRPVSSADWQGWTYKSDSPLALKGGEDYREAVVEQADICERLFRRPLTVVTGAAGTGKTTVIEALIRAVRRAEGEGATILVLAPTGKAADRAREVFEKASLPRVDTVTAHSFLASNGWLNNNLTFKRQGGKRASIETLVIDETSMLDLELAAALMRAIEWQTVRRLILVGDAGQLPPIGRGRVFADIIKWLSTDYPENLGCLQRNLRQLLNKVQGEGNAIVALSELFIVDDEDRAKSDVAAPTRPDQEALLERIHAGGAVDKDLEVIYWDKPEDLAATLIDALERKMIDAGAPTGGQPYTVWRAALENDPTAFQILTPHRGEMHGVEALNEACQKRIADFVISRVGAIDGITLFDKVIQVRNRPKSNPIWAYDFRNRSNVKVEAFNGEIGVVTALGLDKAVWKTLRSGYGPRLKRFGVGFTRKPGLAVGYGRDVPTSGRFINESVEDNLELAYAVSIHKAQGSEFAHTFVIIPKSDKRPVSAELIYTALTRASRHCTLLLEHDINSLLDARRRENAQTPQINSWLFKPHLAKQALNNRRGWYEAGKIHEALSGDMLRSKSEVIIANLLHHNELPFWYERPLNAPDGTLRLPDFTINSRGQTLFWEHLGLLDQTDYAANWKEKQAWYERWFPGQLVTTLEGPHLSRDAQSLIERVTAGAATG